MRYTKGFKVTTDPRLRHCPKPDCIGIARLSPASLALLSTSASTFDSFGLRRHKSQYVEADCDVCHQVFCATCGAGAHPDEACEAVGDADFLRWKQGKRVKPCPSCRYHVQRGGGRA